MPSLGHLIAAETEVWQESYTQVEIAVEPRRVGVTPARGVFTTMV
jgi:hypothetical protein